jgi:hypothetical protein
MSGMGLRAIPICDLRRPGHATVVARREVRLSQFRWGSRSYADLLHALLVTACWCLGLTPPSNISLQPWKDTRIFD